MKLELICPLKSLLAIQLTLLAVGCGKGAAVDKSAVYTNHLINERSPYLQQHAHNPVDWYPWGEEAFQKALREDKPIFLSIGYSTCHWCHVMEKESFEDTAVANLLNKYFVAIKVDREELPAVDELYMSICVAMTGRGGWPLTIVMTPDKIPYFAGTYFPKNDRGGLPGLVTLLPKLAEVYRIRPEIVRQSTAAVEDFLQRNQTHYDSTALSSQILGQAAEELKARYDAEYGGFGGAPKFPAPHQLIFLLRQSRLTGDTSLVQMVNHTLESMRQGGIYDQVGFGFHRYSTDSRWLVPHFEKMLYDQALLLWAYTEAYRYSPKAIFKRTVMELFHFLERDFSSPTGGYYSALDADSEGEEGKYYLWNYSELQRVLTPEELTFLENNFGVRQEGNARVEGRSTNILHLAAPPAHLAQRQKITLDTWWQKWERIRDKLFQIRQDRIPPLRDDKILTQWNSLALGALAIAGRVFEEENFIKRAEKLADFAWNNLRTPSGLVTRCYTNSKDVIPGVLDDYATLAWALCELYETTYDVQYLQKATKLLEQMRQEFHDQNAGGFFVAGRQNDYQLPIRQKTIYDGALPSGNSFAALAYFYVGRALARPEWEELALEVGRTFRGRIQAQPIGYLGYLLSFQAEQAPFREIVISAPSDDGKAPELLQVLAQQPDPFMVVLYRNPRNQRELAELAPYTASQPPVGTSAAAYVCRNYACLKPVTTPAELSALLNQTP